MRRGCEEYKAAGRIESRVKGCVKRNGARPSISAVVRIGRRLTIGIRINMLARVAVRIRGVYGEA